MRPDDETWTDEFGTVWKSPTAWAYAMTCRARQAQQERAERAEADIAAARALLRDCLPELDGEGVTIHRVSGRARRKVIDGSHNMRYDSSSSTHIGIAMKLRSTDDHLRLKPTLAKVAALTQYHFKARSDYWGWGGRNVAEGSVCMIVHEEDVRDGPTFATIRVNIIAPHDLGPNGGNDRADMISEMNDGADGYAVIAAEGKNGASIGKIYPKLFRVIGLIRVAPDLVDAILEAA